MIKIYLFCSAGMSTSMLATRMQEAADEQKKLVYVEAIGFSHMEETLQHDAPDIIMLGPQIKYMYDEIVEKYACYQRPITMIESIDYGMMDGEAVLQKALALLP